MPRETRSGECVARVCRSEAGRGSSCGRAVIESLTGTSNRRREKIDGARGHRAGGEGVLAAGAVRGEARYEDGLAERWQQGARARRVAGQGREGLGGGAGVVAEDGPGIGRVCLASVWRRLGRGPIEWATRPSVPVRALPSPAHVLPCPWPSSVISHPIINQAYIYHRPPAVQGLLHSHPPRPPWDSAAQQTCALPGALCSPLRLSSPALRLRHLCVPPFPLHDHDRLNISPQVVVSPQVEGVEAREALDAVSSDHPTARGSLWVTVCPPSTASGRVGRIKQLVDAYLSYLVVSVACSKVCLLTPVVSQCTHQHVRSSPDLLLPAHARASPSFLVSSGSAGLLATHRDGQCLTRDASAPSTSVLNYIALCFSMYR